MRRLRINNIFHTDVRDVIFNRCSIIVALAQSVKGIIFASANSVMT